MTPRLRGLEIQDEQVENSVEAIKEAARQAKTTNTAALANPGGGQTLITFLRDYGGYHAGASMYMPCTQATLLCDNGVALPAEAYAALHDDKKAAILHVDHSGV